VLVRIDQPRHHDHAGSVDDVVEVTAHFAALNGSNFRTFNND
jgi:hypothetical protein